jgi:hypothetical protein
MTIADAVQKKPLFRHFPLLLRTKTSAIGMTMTPLVYFTTMPSYDILTTQTFVYSILIHRHRPIVIIYNPFLYLLFPYNFLVVTYQLSIAYRLI